MTRERIEFYVALLAGCALMAYVAQILGLEGFFFYLAMVFAGASWGAFVVMIQLRRNPKRLLRGKLQ